MQSDEAAAAAAESIKRKGDLSAHLSVFVKRH
jgi:hypothetical protein